MSGSRGKRRTGSSARRYKSPELVPIKERRPGRIGLAGIFFCAGAIAVAGVIVLLIWSVTNRTITEQRAEIRERAERDLLAHASTMAEEVRTELLSIDQGLILLKAALAQAPETTKLTDWLRVMPALSQLSAEVFIADDKWIVQQSSIVNAAGQRVGGTYVNFAPGALESFGGDGTKQASGRLLVGDTSQTIEARRSLVYIVQPMEQPANWKVGAAYRSDGFTRLFSGATLGINGLAALIDTQRGVVQAIAGPAARKPSADVLGTDMFTFFKNRGEKGNWTGPTAMDGVVRIHGFSKIPNREIVVTAAVAEAEAMARADSFASSVRAVAVGATGVVLGLGGLVVWEIYSYRSRKRRQRADARTQADMEALQSEVTTLRVRSALTSAQVRALLLGSGDGVALLDPDLRLIAWNQAFVFGCGVPIDVFREGLPIDELFRHQARDGLLGALGIADGEDMEIEVARRIAILKLEPAGAVLPIYPLDGDERAFRVAVVPDGGGLVLILGDSTEGARPASYVPPPPPPPQPVAAAPAYVPVDW